MAHLYLALLSFLLLTKPDIVRFQFEHFSLLHTEAGSAQKPVQNNNTLSTARNSGGTQPETMIQHSFESSCVQRPQQTAFMLHLRHPMGCKCHRYQDTGTKSMLPYLGDALQMFCFACSSWQHSAQHQHCCCQHPWRWHSTCWTMATTYTEQVNRSQ